MSSSASSTTWTHAAPGADPTAPHASESRPLLPHLPLDGDDNTTTTTTTSINTSYSSSAPLTAHDQSNPHNIADRPIHPSPGPPRDAEDVFHFRAPASRILSPLLPTAVAFRDISSHPRYAPPTTGVVTIVERDVGGQDDLFAIALTLHWHPDTPETLHPPDPHHQHPLNHQHSKLSEKDQSHHSQQEQSPTHLQDQEQTHPPTPSHLHPSSTASTHPSHSLHIQVDDILALRIIPAAEPDPRAVLYTLGGITAAVFVFPHGVQALTSFVHAIKAHVSLQPIDDRAAPGELFAVESRTRIRRVAPALEELQTTVDPTASPTDALAEQPAATPMPDPPADHEPPPAAASATRGTKNTGDDPIPTATTHEGEDYGDDDDAHAKHVVEGTAGEALECTAPSTSAEADARAPYRRRWRRSTDPSFVVKPAPALLVLEQFARVTQFARDVGDDLARVFSDKRRTEEAARAERERKARERALDIYANFAFDEHDLDDDTANGGSGDGGTNTDSYGAGRIRPPKMILREPRGIPVSSETWDAAFVDNNGTGVLADPTVMRFAIFYGGLEKDVRTKAWPFLLGVYGWNSAEKERRMIYESNIDKYARLKAQWLDLKSDATAADIESLAAAMENLGKDHPTRRGNGSGNNQSSSYQHVPDRHQRVSKLHFTQLDTEEQIAKDIIRTDRLVDIYKEDNSRMLSMMGDILNVYAVYNGDIGYCQGMSDFLSPLLYVFGEHEEALTFWCFEALMQRVQVNFRVDQSGMNAQLSSVRKLLEKADPELYDYFADTDPDFYCVFRWMLVWFKRELPFESTARLWEVMWTRQMAGDKLQVYITVGLLRAHRRNLMKLDRAQFDKLLRYINDMCMRLDVDFALKQGEQCYKEFGHLSG